MRYILLMLCCTLSSCIVFAQNGEPKQSHEDPTKANSSNTVRERAKARPSCCNADVKAASTITFDFETKQAVMPTGKFKKGEAYHLRIINYNPFLYKVAVNNTDSTVATPNSGGVLSFFLDPANLSGIAAGLLNTISPVPPVFQGEKFMEVKGVVAYMANLPDLLEAYEQQDTLFEIKLAGRIVLDTAVAVRSLQGKEREKAERLILEIGALRSEINKALFAINRSASFQRLLYPDCNAFNLTTGNIQSNIQNKVEPFIDSIRREKDTLRNALNQYLLLAAEYRDFIDRKAAFRIPDSLIKTAYGLVTQDLNKMDSTISYQNIDALMSRFETLAQARPCFTSLPIFVQKDVNMIRLEMTPRFDSTALQPYKTEFFLPWVQRRVYGVSAGIYLSGLFGDDYTLRTDVLPNAGGGHDTTYTLVKDDPSKAEFGINALAYSAWKVSKGETPNYVGVSFGAGLSVESKPKPRILLGVAYVNGERNRLVASAGIIGGFTGRLATAYSAGTPYKATPVNFIRDRFKPSVFLSVNYSFL